MSDIKNTAIKRYGITLSELGRILSKEINPLRLLLEEKANYKAAALSTKIPGTVIRQIFSLNYQYPKLVIGFINLKGGIGKTTSAVTFAARTCDYGFRTCLIDLDAQASATLMMGSDPEEEPVIFNDIWQNPEDPQDYLQRIEEDLYLIPSSLENSLLDLNLSNPSSQKQAVKNVCNILQEQNFDLIVVDCPPSLGTAVISTACAADKIVIPVGMDAFSYRGLELTLSEVETIRSTFGLEKTELHILRTMVDRRLNLAETSLKRLSGKYGDLLLPHSIHTSSEFSKTLEKSETVFAHSRKSRAKEDYDNLTKSLLGLKLF